MDRGPGLAVNPGGIRRAPQRLQDHRLLDIVAGRAPAVSRGVRPPGRPVSAARLRMVALAKQRLDAILPELARPLPQTIQFLEFRDTFFDRLSHHALLCPFRIPANSSWELRVIDKLFAACGAA